MKSLFSKSLYTLTLALFLLSGRALAHTDLLSSSPGDGDILQQAPETVELVFQAPVRLMTFELAAAEQPIALELPRGTGSQERFSIPLPSLHSGQYRASWTIMGADTHRMSGSFDFVIASEGDTARNTDSDSANDDRTPSDHTRNDQTHNGDAHHSDHHNSH